MALLQVMGLALAVSTLWPGSAALVLPLARPLRRLSGRVAARATKDESPAVDEEGATRLVPERPSDLLASLESRRPTLEPGPARGHLAGRLRSTPTSLAREEAAARAAEKAEAEAKAAAAAEAAAEAAAAAELGLPPLAERTFLVTGATSGIGRFTAELLAKAGCKVLLHGRDEKKLIHMMKVFNREIPGCRMDAFQADLSLMSEVRELASEVASRHPVIHGILHNAASMDGDFRGKRKLTKEDNEHSMAVNALAPFLLTSLLMENVQASGAGRVVFSSSTTMGKGSFLDDLCCERAWSGNHAYTLGKLCNSMVAQEMHEHFGDAPRLCVHAINPGVVDTKLMRHGASWGRGRRTGRKWRTTFGLLPHVRTATASFEALTKNRFQEVSGLQVEGSPSEVNDPAKRARLWEDLEAITGATWYVPAAVAA